MARPREFDIDEALDARVVKKLSRAVYHDILEFCARVLDAALSSYAVARSPFASNRKRDKP